MASQLVGDSAVLEWSSYIRGHHVYCEIWTPEMEEILSLKNEPDNSHYQFSVPVLKSDIVVGHVHWSVSRLIFHFLTRDDHSGFCEVIGNRLNRRANL